MLDKVYHVQNLASKNTSSDLKSTEGHRITETQLCAFTHCHFTAKAQYEGTTTIKWLKLAGPVSLLALVQGDVE